MQRTYRFLRQFLADEEGVTSMEYALMGGLVAVVIVAAVTSVGTNLSTFYSMVATKIANAV